MTTFLEYIKAIIQNGWEISFYQRDGFDYIKISREVYTKVFSDEQCYPLHELDAIMAIDYMIGRLQKKIEYDQSIPNTLKKSISKQ